MSPTYKLSYFNGKGLAESIRWLLSYSGEEFEDIRFTGEDWPTVKKTVPFGKVPMLEIDGEKLTQSVALSRYLGKKAGLGGKDAWEDLQIDIIVDTIGDFRQVLSSLNLMNEKDEKVKAEKLDKFGKETVSFYMSRLDTIVKENNGYVANGKLSWADIYFVSIVDFISTYIGSDIVTAYSNLSALQKRITSIPNIKAWIEKRPESAF